MKKVFKIASYDFKRLVFNPFTLIVFVAVLGICLITGLAYKIQTTPAYVAAVSGQTTKEIFSNFNSTNSMLDTKSSLDKIFEESKIYLEVQRECFDHEDLTTIHNLFNQISLEVDKFDRTGSCTYTEKNNIDEIKLASKQLQTFVEDFKKKDEFKSNLIFQKKQFENLENLSVFFNETVNAEKSLTTILNDLHENEIKFAQLNSIVNNVFVWQVDAEKIAAYQTQYIDRAETKMKAIYSEMSTLNSQSTSYDKENIDAMTSLATNYKLTSESAKFSVEFELRILLEKHFGNLKNLFNIQNVPIEETKLALAKINFFLQDDGLYYTQYQVPLNFNTASYEVSAFDHSYFVVSIAGFILILFGIFCAYKLFGRDRKRGKMDVLFSQTVTFNQVFAGKFLAIVFATSFFLAVFAILSIFWGALLYGFLPNGILAVFNLNSVYTIHPLLFYLVKLVGIELQVIFYAVITIFLMNISRKFEVSFAIALILFAVATICNIFLNGTLIYCLFPFIHADITSFLGGGLLNNGFLQTSLYAFGNFFISLIYYLVVVVLLYNFTKQLFKKN